MGFELTQKVREDALALELWSLLAGGGRLSIDTGVDLQALLDKHGAATGSRDTGRRLYVVTDFPGKEKHGRTDEQIAALNESNNWDETRCVKKPAP